MQILHSVDNAAGFSHVGVITDPLGISIDSWAHIKRDIRFIVNSATLLPLPFAAEQSTHTAEKISPASSNNAQPKGLHISNVLNQTLFDEGEPFGERLECLYSERVMTLSTQIKRHKGKIHQPRYEENEIYTLEKHGTQYKLKNRKDGAVIIPDGDFVFVIPCSSPDEILCAKLDATESNSNNQYFRKGHSSFLGDAPVQFAGMMRFSRNTLAYWNNLSGHYTPSAELRYTLLTYLKHVLPETRFLDYGFMLNRTYVANVFSPQNPSR